MPIKTLILHIGRAKTGTSTIQKFLAENRNALRTRGVHYLAAGRTPRQGQKEFANTFVDRPPSFMPIPADPGAVRSAVAAEIAASDAPHLLLSSENFSGGNVRELRAFFASLLPAASVQVIFFARSQDELAESEYNQFVRAAGYTGSFDDYIQDGPGEMDFAAVLAPWVEAFGRESIVARVYDASARNVVEDFLRCLPLAEGEAGLLHDAGEASNDSAGYLATCAFKALNAVPTEFRKKPVFQALRGALSPFDRPALYFDAVEARAFRDRYRESNRIFIRDHLGGTGHELGGRRYTDAERDAIRIAIRRLKAESAGLLPRSPQSERDRTPAQPSARMPASPEPKSRAVERIARDSGA